jgi:hypothetical protein
MANMLSGIIFLAISVVVLVNVLIVTVKGTNTTGWTAGETSLFGVITLAAIAGLVYGVLQVFGLA